MGHYKNRQSTFLFQLLSRFRLEHIQIFLTFRVDVKGLNQYVQYIFLYFQMNYLVPCYFLVKIFLAVYQLHCGRQWGKL